ncbi:hypothetical protein D0Z00_002571 [Geotrichum galactomycetum]|uniref:Uncharacterized protein n=1 Tax=Geotrichum galactomycetum TaxID=27317 RepID=A0ACB6V3Q6_9ASCO|nr:hypothetical protein D0Z00_002571 [Geotrichum candidum]
MSSATPPLAYATLRAHAFPVTTTSFARLGRARVLVSGDEGGWCFVWDLRTRRPVAIFRAHTKAVIAVRALVLPDAAAAGGLVIVTHGRDHLLKVHRADPDLLRKPPGYNTALPLQSDDGTAYPSLPVIYSQDVNALNFCSVAFARALTLGGAASRVAFAVPSTLASENIDVYTVDLASGQLSRIVTALEAPKSPNQPLFDDAEVNRNAGIVMALLLVEISGTSDYALVAAYESGLIAVHRLVCGTDGYRPTLLYATKCHSQPVLSLDADPLAHAWFLSSAADAKIFQHPLAPLLLESPLARGADPWITGPTVTFNAKHAGLSALAVRPDAKLFATAGWDGMIRVFDARANVKKQQFRALAVFKGGRQNGVTTVAFSPPDDTDPPKDTHVDANADLATKLELLKPTSDNLLAVGGKDGRISLYALY